jgi:protein TonB
MRIVLFICALLAPTIVFAQKPSVADTAQSDIKKPPPPQSVSNDDPSQDEFIEIDDEPKPIQDIQKLVKYPEEARRAGLEGKVMVSILIGKDGNIKRITIDKADADVFRQPVIDALKKVRFTPARKDGKPVMVWYTQSISFKLSQYKEDEDQH